jgi:hypothetical protein
MGFGFLIGLLWAVCGVDGCLWRVLVLVIVK